MDKQTLGDVLRDIRIAQEVGTKQFSQQIGQPEHILVMIESGKLRMTEREAMFCARKLNCDENYFIELSKQKD